MYQIAARERAASCRGGDGGRPARDAAWGRSAEGGGARAYEQWLAARDPQMQVPDPVLVVAFQVGATQAFVASTPA